jgi:hypothetical protein
MYVAGGCAHRAARTAAAPPVAAPAPSHDDELRREAMRQLQNLESMLDAVAVVRGLSLPSRPQIEILDDAPFSTACGEELRGNIARVVGGAGWRGPSAGVLGNPERNCNDLAAIYDTHHDRVIIKRSSYYRRTRSRRVELLSHELEHAIVAHALPTAPPLHGVDELSALHALEEGDATVTSVAFLLSLNGKPLRDTIPKWIARIDADEPQSLHDSTFFAYNLGTRFVLELYQRGGFLAVNDAFTRPPASSAELLHVDRYLAPTQRPNVATRLALPAPFVPLLSDARGEFGLRDMLSYCVLPAPAMTLAANWLADEFTASKNEAGKQMLRWVVAWRSEAAAKQFAGVIGHCLWTLKMRVAQKGAVTVAVSGPDDDAARRYAGEVLADVLGLP